MKLNKVQKKIVNLNKTKIILGSKSTDKNSKFPEYITRFLDKDDLMMLLGYHNNKKSMSPLEECLFYYECSKYCSTVRNYFLVSIGMVGATIFKFGSLEQKKNYIYKIINKKGVASLAITEKESGSNINSIKSSYKIENDYYILNGKKTWITLGGRANIILILATGEKGLILFYTEKNKFIKTKKIKNIISNKGSEISEISFKNLKINKKNIIGITPNKSIEALNYALMNGRAIAGISAVGMSSAALEEASKYSLSRVQFGKPICSFQQIQNIISNSAIKIAAAKSLSEKTFIMKRKNYSKNKNLCNFSKLYSSNVIIEITSELMQIFGANGINTKFNIERYSREAQGFRFIEGTSQIISQLISNYIVLKNRV